MPIKTHKYSNNEITVLWQPDKCIHSAICFKGLPGVFDPRRKPWINLSQSDSNLIVEQVKKCPSRALSILETPDLNNNWLAYFFCEFITVFLQPSQYFIPVVALNNNFSIFYRAAGTAKGF